MGLGRWTCAASQNLQRFLQYPERFARESLGHNSKAVHRSYAKRAKAFLPPLEESEKKVIPLPPAHRATAVGPSLQASA